MNLARSLLRRWIIIVAVCVAVLTPVGVALVLNPGEVTSTARVEIGEGRNDPRSLNNALVFARSDEVRPLLDPAAGVTFQPEIEEDSTILSLHVTSTDPFQAQALADEWMDRLLAQWNTFNSSELSEELEAQADLWAADREAYFAAREDISQRAEQGGDIAALQLEDLTLLVASGGQLAFASGQQDVWQRASLQLDRADSPAGLTVLTEPELPARRSLERHMTFVGAVVLLIAVITAGAVDWVFNDR